MRSFAITGATGGLSTSAEAVLRGAAAIAMLFAAFAPVAARADEAAQRKAIDSVVKTHRCDMVRVFYKSKALGKEQSYALFVPKTYDPARPQPVVVFLHSWYDKFDQKQWLRVAEIPGTIQNECNDRGWIAIGPEGGGNSWYNPAAERQVLESVDDVNKYVKLDTQRLLLVGRSMGGGGALSMAVHHPDRVVGVVALAGISDFVEYANGNADLLLAKAPGTVLTAFGGTPESAPQVYRHMSAIHSVDKLKNMPVYLIHGDKDTIVPTSNSRKIAAALKKAGGQVVYKEVAGQEHNMEMIEWFAPEYFKFIEAHSPKLKGRSAAKSSAGG